MRAVYLCRVSTDEEKQLNAFKIQCEEAEDCIKAHGWELVDKYLDEGVSGTSSEKRDEFKRLLADLYKDKFDVVVVKSEDRVGRNFYESNIFLHTLISNTKKMYYFMEKKFFNPEEELLNAVKFGMAAQFSRDLSKKINHSQKKRMEKGRVITNGTLWGYNQKDGALTINEGQAEIVRFIFNEYAGGIGFRRIRDMLIERGITNANGTPFSLTTLKRMIRQEKYIGRLICNKKHKDFNTKKILDVPESEWVVHEDVIPAIITKETWDKVQLNLSAKKKIVSRERQDELGYYKGLYPLSGKMFCGICGRVYWYCTYKQKNHDLYYWQCSGYKLYRRDSELGCKNRHVKVEYLDEDLKKCISSFWINRKEAISNVLKVLSRALETSDFGGEIKTLEKEFGKIENRKAALIDNLLDGTISKSIYQSKIEQFDNQIKEIEIKLSSIKVKQNLHSSEKDRLSNMEKFMLKFDGDDENLSSNFIKNFVDKVIVHHDKIGVTICGIEHYVNVSDTRAEWTQLHIHSLEGHYKVEMYLNSGL